MTTVREPIGNEKTGDLRDNTWSGWRRAMQAVMFLILIALITFTAAGRLSWAGGWYYLAFWFVATVLLSFRLVLAKPDLVQQRADMHPGTRLYEKVFFGIYVPSLFLIPTIGALDACRYKWTSLDGYVPYIGAALFVVGSIISVWAMTVNTARTSDRRLSDGKGLSVTMEGPYLIIRHPNYLAAILLYTGSTLVLGSLYALIPLVAIVFAFFYRAAGEDKLLVQTLEGYEDFTKKTRKKVLPFIW